MAAITENTTDSTKALRFLEDVTITDQTAASTAVRKFIRVPGWAKSVSFYLYVDSTDGTTPSLDFDVEAPDFGDLASWKAPDDGNVGVIKTITAITGAGPYLVQVHIGPDVEGSDNASATADSEYYVSTPLPPVLAYKYTTTDSNDDADYAFRLVAQFRA